MRNLLLFGHFSLFCIFLHAKGFKKKERSSDKIFKSPSVGQVKLFRPRSIKSNLCIATGTRLEDIFVISSQSYSLFAKYGLFGRGSAILGIGKEAPALSVLHSLTATFGNVRVDIAISLVCFPWTPLPLVLFCLR